MLYLLEPIDKVPKQILEERILIGCRCVFCNNTTEPISVFPDDFAKWQEGELAQRAFPYLTPDQREILISEICPECFNKMISNVEEHIKDVMDNNDN
jgi:hypothetical protein